MRLDNYSAVKNKYMQGNAVACMSVCPSDICRHGCMLYRYIKTTKISSDV